MHKVPVRVVRELWWQELLETTTEIFQDASMRVAMVHDVDQFDRTTLDHLVQHILGVEDSSLSLLIGVEAADVVD